jgi:large subunit ribosomal protein L20
MRALAFQYRDRRTLKRDMRRLWIQRINAASRANGLQYSRLIQGLSAAGIAIDRKMLADLAVRDEDGFAAVVDAARQALPANA